ncbi:RAD52 motif-containing protein 1 isoform X1 [Alosa sapidissima]|uniref:RAD52 motif-containing protein 1 isoform X1 n=1 Tax=Alosa sapidissima TaxID=34773 RepID=UPI001C09FA06|nr:RAD52 motif-containing protein 1 isoform X1 [Alosa sapidissima]
MEIVADIIEFRVPSENNKTLFVWDILPDHSEAYVYEAIWNVFSAFGALYLVKVCPNAALAKPGFYAMVKFYSAAQASKAQSSTDKTCLFQRSPVTVRLSTRVNSAFQLNAKPLSHARCQELANHYLGFNGWSTHILTMKDFSSCSRPGTGIDGLPEGGSGSQESFLKYGCMVEVTFPQHGTSCRGIGVTEEPLDGDERLEEVLWKRGKLQKWARDKAVVNAFEKVLLVVLGNGKVAVECKIDPDEILPNDEVEGIIKVNDIPWSEYEKAGGDEEDISWDFSLHVAD